MADSQDQLDVNEVMAEMRGIIGEQGQTIAMLRTALKKTARPQAATQDEATHAPPPTPTQEAI